MWVLLVVFAQLALVSYPPSTRSRFFFFFLVTVRDCSLLDPKGPHKPPNLSPLHMDLMWMIFLEVTGSRTEHSAVLSPLTPLSFFFSCSNLWVLRATNHLTGKIISVGIWFGTFYSLFIVCVIKYWMLKP